MPGTEPATASDFSRTQPDLELAIRLVNPAPKLRLTALFFCVAGGVVLALAMRVEGFGAERLLSLFIGGLFTAIAPVALVQAQLNAGRSDTTLRLDTTGISLPQFGLVRRGVVTVRWDEVARITGVEKNGEIVWVRLHTAQGRLMIGRGWMPAGCSLRELFIAIESTWREWRH